MRLRTVVTASLMASALTLTAFATFSAHAQGAPAVLQIAQANTDSPAARLQDAVLALKKARKAFRAAKQSGKGVKAAGIRLRKARDEHKAAQQAVLAAGRPADGPVVTEGQKPETVLGKPAPAVQPKTATGRRAPAKTGNPLARLNAAILAEKNARRAYRAARKSGKGERAARARLRVARDELNAAQQSVAELTRQKTPPPAAKSTETAKAKTGIAGETVDPQVQQLRKKLRQARKRAQKAEQSAAEAQARAAGGEVVKSESDRVIIKLGD